MIPNIISSRFKRSGIYPFNPNAIDYRIDGSMLEKQLHNKTSSISANTNYTSSATECTEKQQQKSFSADQEKLYKRRYEENYNLRDPEYLEWFRDGGTGPADPAFARGHRAFTLWIDLRPRSS